MSELNNQKQNISVAITGQTTHHMKSGKNRPTVYIALEIIAFFHLSATPPISIPINSPKTHPQPLSHAICV